VERRVQGPASVPEWRTVPLEAVAPAASMLAEKPAEKLAEWWQRAAASVVAVARRRARRNQQPARW